MEQIETTTSIVQTPIPEIIITPLREQALSLLQYATERVIKTQDDMIPATEDLSLIAKASKRLEEARKGYVTPLNNQVKAINAEFKLVSDPLGQADSITRKKMLAFTAEQDQLRFKQEEFNRHRMELAREEASLNNGEITESINLVEVIAPAPTRTRTDIGSVSQHENWKWELLDISLVPKEYLLVNAGLLTPVVKASKGKIIIPGIRVYNEPGLTVNTK